MKSYASGVLAAILMFILAILVMASLAGCGLGDPVEPEPEPEEKEESPPKVERSIVGRWEAVEWLVWLNIKIDNTYTVEYSSGVYNGAWQVDTRFDDTYVFTDEACGWEFIGSYRVAFEDEGKVMYMWGSDACKRGFYWQGKWEEMT